MTRVLIALVALALQGCGMYYLQPDPNLLPVGATAPAFELPSAAGPPVTLDALRAQGNVVLVLYRGHW